jgi:foldase protein PrsA
MKKKQNIKENLTKKLMPKKVKKETLKKYAIPALLIVILVFSLINFKHLFIAATVNNRLITRISLDRELEKSSGKDTLDSLITKNLILQEAKKLSVSPTDEEINQKIDEINVQLEEQGTTVEQALALQGRSLSELKEQLEIQVIVEKILGRDVEVSEEEIATYFEENKAFFAEDATLESEKETIKEQLFQQALSVKFQDWLESLKEKANIKYFLKL